MHPEYGPIMCFGIRDEAGLNRFPSVRALLRRNMKAPCSGLTEVSHIGTGAVAIRRDVLESFTWDLQYDKIIPFLSSIKNGDSNKNTVLELHRFMSPDVPFMVPDSLRMEGFRHAELRCGEDIWFCCQIKKKGFKIYVENSTDVGHRKSMCITLDDVFRDPDMKPEDWVLPMEGPVITVE